MCWHDTEFSTVWHVTTRRARKAHRCYECDTGIGPKERHIHISSLYDGRWDAYRVCLPCWGASDALTEACRLYDATTYSVPLGALTEALDEHLRGERWRIGSPPEGLSREALRDLNRHHVRLNRRHAMAGAA